MNLNNRLFYTSSYYIDVGKFKIFRNNYLKRVQIFLKNKYKLNKFIIFELCLEFFLKIGSFFFLPLGLIFYFLGYRIYVVDPYSFGDYIIELHIIKKKFKSNKILIPIPNDFMFKSYNKLLFKKFNFIDNLFFTPILLSLNYWRFFQIKLFPFKEKVVEAKHNKYMIKDYNNPHYVFKEFETNKVLNKINFSHNKFSKEKIAIINPRFLNTRNNLLRNSEIQNYSKAIKFLKSRKFSIFMFSDNDKIIKKAQRLKINIYNIKNKKNQITQINTFKKCNFYLGSYSGMGHFTDVYEIPSIYTDEIFFNAQIFNKNSYVIPKKIKDKNNNIISYKKIYNMKLDNLFIDKEIKNLKVINSNSIEILNSTRDYLNKKNLKVKKVFKYLPNYSVLHKVPLSYYKLNKKLFYDC